MLEAWGVGEGGPKMTILRAKNWPTKSSNKQRFLIIISDSSLNNLEINQCGDSLLRLFV